MRYMEKKTVSREDLEVLEENVEGQYTLNKRYVRSRWTIETEDEAQSSDRWNVM